MKHLLNNNKSPYDIKGVQAVKKLDNSIYQFQQLADRAKDIIRTKTKIYNQLKSKITPEKELDADAFAQANNPNHPELKSIFMEYKQMYKNLSESRSNSQIQD